MTHYTTRYTDPERAAALLEAASEAWTTGDHEGRGRMLTELSTLVLPPAEPPRPAETPKVEEPRRGPPNAPARPAPKPAAQTPEPRRGPPNTRAKLLASRPDFDPELRAVLAQPSRASIELVRHYVTTIPVLRAARATRKETINMTTTADRILALTKSAFSAPDAVTQETALNALRAISPAEAAACEKRLRAMGQMKNVGGVRMVDGQIQVSARTTNTGFR